MLPTRISLTISIPRVVASVYGTRVYGAREGAKPYFARFTNVVRRIIIFWSADQKSHVKSRQLSRFSL